MYFDDHPPPHFHVITRSDEAEEALAWAAVNRPELWARWQQYSEEES